MGLAAGADIYALTAASGVADVDAITLSLSRMAATEVILYTASIGIVIASVVNSLAKAVMAWGTGGSALGVCVRLPMIAAVVAGPSLLMLLAD